MIGLRDARVSFGARTVLAGLSFVVEPGRTLGILGPNGRGKTTAIKALLGFQKLDAGEAIAPDVVGYVPQVSAFAHPYKVIDVVTMGRAKALGLFGQPGPEDRRVALEALATVGMGAMAESGFDRLSGGERQLILLARALATGSRAIVLDEPGSALDLRNQQRLLALLSRLRREGRHAILFTTHDPNHVLAVADDALLMMPPGVVDGDALLGPIDEVMTEANLSLLYDVKMSVSEVRDAHGAARRTVTPWLDLDSEAA